MVAVGEGGAPTEVVDTVEEEEEMVDMAVVVGEEEEVEREGKVHPLV